MMKESVSDGGSEGSEVSGQIRFTKNDEIGVHGMFRVGEYSWHSVLLIAKFRGDALRPLEIAQTFSLHTLVLHSTSCMYVCVCMYTCVYASNHMFPHT